MDLTQIVKELVDELDMIERAILSLERLAHHRGKRRGRPPAWMAILEKGQIEPKKRGGPRRVAGAGK
jgi:hypothetical protein